MTVRQLGQNHAAPQTQPLTSDFTVNSKVITPHLISGELGSNAVQKETKLCKSCHPYPVLLSNRAYLCKYEASLFTDESKHGKWKMQKNLSCKLIQKFMLDKQSLRCFLAKTFTASKNIADLIYQESQYVHIKVQSSPNYTSSLYY